MFKEVKSEIEVGLGKYGYAYPNSAIRASSLSGGIGIAIYLPNNMCFLGIHDGGDKLSLKEMIDSALLLARLAAYKGNITGQKSLNRLLDTTSVDFIDNIPLDLERLTVLLVGGSLSSRQDPDHTAYNREVSKLRREVKSFLLSYGIPKNKIRNGYASLDDSVSDLYVLTTTGSALVVERVPASNTKSDSPGHPLEFSYDLKGRKSKVSIPKVSLQN